MSVTSWRSDARWSTASAWRGSVYASVFPNCAEGVGQRVLERVNGGGLLVAGDDDARAAVGLQVARDRLDPRLVLVHRGDVRRGARPHADLEGEGARDGLDVAGAHGQPVIGVR